MGMKLEKPVILAYHMEEEGYEALHREMGELELETRRVLPEQETVPLGWLAGQPGRKVGAPAPEASELTEAMVVLCGLGDRKLDAALSRMKQRKIPVGLKAVLTEYNAGWSGRQLQTELKRERGAIRKSLKR